MMMLRSLLGVAILAVSVPAMAVAETVKPIQAVAHSFGERPVLAYFTRGPNGTCDAVLMTNQEPGPRVRVSLMPSQAATIEDVSGGSVTVTCGALAAEMLVDRRAAPAETASVR